MNNIEGKVVIITGASSGIGEATAKKLGNLGAKIVLAARRTERLEVLKKQIEQNSGHIINISSNAAYTEIYHYRNRSWILCHQNPPCVFSDRTDRVRL